MFYMRFDTDNAAFSDDPEGVEITRILNTVIDQIRCGHEDGKIYDINGNAVGQWSRVWEWKLRGHGRKA